MDIKFVDDSPCKKNNNYYHNRRHNKEFNENHHQGGSFYTKTGDGHTSKEIPPIYLRNNIPANTNNITIQHQLQPILTENTISHYPPPPSSSSPGHHVINSTAAIRLHHNRSIYDKVTSPDELQTAIAALEREISKISTSPSVTSNVTTGGTSPKIIFEQPQTRILNATTSNKNNNDIIKEEYNNNNKSSLLIIPPSPLPGLRHASSSPQQQNSSVSQSSHPSNRKMINCVDIDGTGAGTGNKGAAHDQDYEFYTYFNDGYNPSSCSPRRNPNGSSAESFPASPYKSTTSSPRFKLSSNNNNNRHTEIFSADSSLNGYNYSLDSPAKNFIGSGGSNTNSSKTSTDVPNSHQQLDSSATFVEFAYPSAANRNVQRIKNDVIANNNSNNHQSYRHSLYASAAPAPRTDPVAIKGSYKKVNTKICQIDIDQNDNIHEDDFSTFSNNNNNASEMSSVCEFDSEGEEIDLSIVDQYSQDDFTSASNYQQHHLTPTARIPEQNLGSGKILKTRNIISKLGVRVLPDSAAINDKSFTSSSTTTTTSNDDRILNKSRSGRIGEQRNEAEEETGSTSYNSTVSSKSSPLSFDVKRTDKYGFFGGYQYLAPPSFEDDNSLLQIGEEEVLSNKGDTLTPSSSFFTTTTNNNNNNYITNQSKSNNYVARSSKKDDQKNSGSKKVSGSKSSSQHHQHSKSKNALLITLRNREKKWKGMIDHWEKYLKNKPEKIRERCRKGVPPAMRGLAWQYLCGVPAIRGKNTNLFKLLASEDQKGDPLVMDEIKRDLHRQFPYHEMFAEHNGAGQRDLFAVLKVYSLMRPKDGYCQAQAPLAAVLLMQMPAEAAFWCLLSICDNYLPGYFGPGLEALQLDGQVFYGLLKRFKPSLYRLLKKQGIQPSLIVTEWFMCVYSRTLTWGCVLRIWDMFLSEGVSVLFKVGLILFKIAFSPSASNLALQTHHPMPPGSASSTNTRSAAGATNIFGGSMPMLHFGGSHTSGSVASLTARYPSMYETMGALQALKTKSLDEDYLVSEICKLRIPRETFEKERQYLKKRK